MSRLRLQSATYPFDKPELGARASRFLGRAEAMGLLPGVEPLYVLDTSVLLKVIRELVRAGIGRDTLVSVSAPSRREPADWSVALDQLNEALEISPVPQREWQPLLEALGDELLARLLGISPSSIHRYATGQRSTPEAVANRLHVLALLVADLAGGYNEIGVRRWFDRPRAQLGGKRPAELLRAEWSPDSEAAHRVRSLAAAFADSPVT